MSISTRDLWEGAMHIDYRAAAAAVAAVAAALLVGATAPAAAAAPGFKTAQPPMLTPLAPNSHVTPIMTVGETLADGYRFEAIPDGIALRGAQRGVAHVFVNHETSTVPFPLGSPPTISNSLNDFDNAQLSELVLSRPAGGILRGRYVIPSSANYQRFCSNFLAGPEAGFDRPLLFTNEEASDVVNRTGMAWPAGPPFGSDTEQAGVVVAYDPGTREYRSIYRMGRMNHENAVALPGYGFPAVLTGDDTFSAPSSQLYLYLAGDRDEVWNGGGRLLAFRADDPAINDYGDLSGSMSVSGRFIRVPDAVADGDQTGLENWSNENNVFQFIRVEDIAYDRNRPNVVYFADTGEPRAIPDEATGRLRRGPSGTMGPYPNGRVFRMVLDRNDPRRVLRLSILIDADLGGYGNPSVLHNPDNVETTAHSVLVQEDPGSHNTFAPGQGPNARIWRYDLETGAFTVVAEVDQSADPAARAGAWESSGIIDASQELGRGVFLVNVQAHTIFVETAPGPDIFPPEGPDWLYKREGGQLLAIRLPGV